jgi:hypothetical protein
MATYKEAIEWIALNDDAATEPFEVDYDEAYERVYGYISTALITDIFHKDQEIVTKDILKLRGYRIPKK